MKRNMDLVREELESIEGVGRVTVIGPDALAVPVDGYTPDEIWYHLELIREKGLIECPKTQPMIGVASTRLTWEGHDFLDSVRDPEIWKRTKRSADAVGGFTFELLRDLAKGLLKKQVEEYTGVKLRAGWFYEREPVGFRLELASYERRPVNNGVHCNWRLQDIRSLET